MAKVKIRILPVFVATYFEKNRLTSEIVNNDMN